VQSARDGVESEMRQHLEPALRAEKEDRDKWVGRRVALESRLEEARKLLKE